MLILPQASHAILPMFWDKLLYLDPEKGSWQPRTETQPVFGGRILRWIRAPACGTGWEARQELLPQPTELGKALTRAARTQARDPSCWHAHARSSMPETRTMSIVDRKPHEGTRRAFSQAWRAL